MSEYYKAHKAEIDEVAKNHGDLTPYLDGFEEFEADVDANDTYVAQLKAQAEAEREAQRREGERLFQERIDEERREREDSERKRAYVEANLPAEFVASNGVTIKPKGYSEYPAYRDGEAITSASSSNKRKAASKARAEFKEQIIAPLEEAYASQNEAKLSLRDIANDVREYDATNGTELYDWLSFVESGSIAKNKTQFHIANTGEILNEYGIKGKINVTRKAINTKRHTDNDDHKLGVSGWAFLVATINSPLVITRYNNEPNSYRIYTIAEINGKNICAGVDVNATNGVEITKITTAFGRDITKIEASSKEKEIYRNENAAEQISGSDNSHLYARLLSTTKVIQNFENPKIEPKNSLRELDAPYLEAVERGDMETAQRMVLEAAKRAMPDTKVVDENGTPKVVYHATPGDTFYKFDISHFGATDGGSLGKGFYFAETKRMTEAYGPNVHSYFLNLSNPINAKLNEIEAFVLGSKTKEDLYERLKLQESFSSQEEMEAMYAIIDSIPQEMIDEVNSTYDGSYYPADELSEYMAVEPNQIKSADPVTYDDNGNVIPLSERFNPKKEDVRYSLGQPTDEAVTFDNFFERTSAIFTQITDTPTTKPNYISRSGSTYWYGEDERGKYVIRRSDHWSAIVRDEEDAEAFNAKPDDFNNIASCYWALDMRTYKPQSFAPINKETVRSINYNSGSKDLNIVFNDGKTTRRRGVEPRDMRKYFELRNSGDMPAANGYVVDMVNELYSAAPMPTVQTAKAYLNEFTKWTGESEQKSEQKSELYSVQEVNDRFNEELAMLTEENARERILNIGIPSPVLLACGIENKPIRLYGAKLLSKARKHSYNIEDLKNLPLAINEPIAVFKGSKSNSFAILTELRIDDNNVLATLSVGRGGHDVDFNIISSVYDKRDDSVARWVNDGKLLYVDKEKALDYFSVSAPLAEAQNNQELISTTKVIQNFVNPKIEPKYSLQDTETEKIVELSYPPSGTTPPPRCGGRCRRRA